MPAKKKKKAVFTAEPDQIAKIHAIVRSGRYRSSSELLREAIEEKLERLRRERLVQQVERHCGRKASKDEAALIASQAWEEDES